MKVIGLDVGEKRIGIARADSTTRIAVPHGYINVDGSEWQQLAHLSDLLNTRFFVIGLPRSNEGSETKQSLYVRNFAKTLVEKLPEVKIRFQDESLTSVVAEERLKQRRKPYEKGEIDAEAATIILQDFLENPNIANPGTTPGATIPEAAKNQPANRPETDGKAAELVSLINGVATGVVNKQDLEKAKLTARKAKHKMKKATKWISGIAILAIIGLIAVGVLLFIRDQRYKEYAEQFRQIESEMQAEVFSFTILPGETLKNVRNKLIQVGYSEVEADEALQANYDYDFLRDRPEGASLEGYLFGETHEFYETATAREVIETFLKSMGQAIADNQLKEKYAAHNLSLYEGITLASIVQKEANAPDMPTVAQVFLSRLGYGLPLGSDVTVSYAVDQVDPERTIYGDNAAALKIDSCYNTRLYAGLPCGPIANPGLAALRAVAEPSDSSYLYFLTGDDGLMYYSYTEAEHLQNIYSHCQELCNATL